MLKIHFNKKWHNYIKSYWSIQKHHLLFKHKSLFYFTFHIYSNNSQKKRTLMANLKTFQLTSNLFNDIFSEDMRILFGIFKKYGFQIRIAGGAVRDLLMDKKPFDFDFATPATPVQMKDMFLKETIRLINPKGESHGTITVRINDRSNYEITTLRIDCRTDGRHAEVEFTDSWKLDAARRDLTINAMYLDENGIVYDYFNGLEDLKNERIAFVGNPLERIQEDYLRILRYFRFYGSILCYSKSHETDILNAFKNNASGLYQISGERIWSELKRILSSHLVKDLLLVMLQLGLGPPIGLPQNVNFIEFEKLCTLQKQTGYIFHPITLLVSLLQGENEVLNLHNRLHLSGFERDLGLFLISQKQQLKDKITVKYFQDLLVDCKEKQNELRNMILQFLLACNETKKYEEICKWKIPRFPVSGYSLLERGIKGPKNMKKTMGFLVQAWKNSNFELNENELLSLLKNQKSLYDKS